MTPKNLDKLRAKHQALCTASRRLDRLANAVQSSGDTRLATKIDLIANTVDAQARIAANAIKDVHRGRRVAASALQKLFGDSLPEGWESNDEAGRSDTMTLKDKDYHVRPKGSTAVQDFYDYGPTKLAADLEVGDPDKVSVQAGRRQAGTRVSFYEEYANELKNSRKAATFDQLMDPKSEDTGDPNDTLTTSGLPSSGNDKFFQDDEQDDHETHGQEEIEQGLSRLPGSGPEQHDDVHADVEDALQDEEVPAPVNNPRVKASVKTFDPKTEEKDDLQWLEKLFAINQ